MEALAEEAKPLEERLREAVGRTFEEAESLLRRERRASEEAFAITQFVRHGGQEAFAAFGHEAVVSELAALAHPQKQGKEPTFLDLTRKLVPNPQERDAFHAAMHGNAAAFLYETERRRDALNERPQDATAFARLREPIDKGYVQGVELVASACRREDEAHILPNRLDQKLLREAIEPLLACLKETPELGTRLRQRGPLAAIAELDEERHRFRAARLERMNQAIRLLETAIQEITEEEERHAKPGLEALSQKLAGIIASAGQRQGPALVERLAPIGNELARQNRQLQEAIIRRTHHLGALKAHAKKLSIDT